MPPHRRETGMVFQNYALFPHLSVFDNIAYGLRARKVPRREIAERIGEVIGSVQLEGLEGRAPSQLSGGQQQRVALARALVISPQILLMDEPLSNLDAKLRVSMREEIRRIQKELGITTIYVTHDQEEAMAVSDRIAILNRGRLEQVGTPGEIYSRPVSRFAAEFMGSSNIMEMAVTGYDEASRADRRRRPRGQRISDPRERGPPAPGSPCRSGRNGSPFPPKRRRASPTSCRERSSAAPFWAPWSVTAFPGPPGKADRHRGPRSREGGIRRGRRDPVLPYLAGQAGRIGG